MQSNPKPKWIEGGTDRSLEIPNVALAMVTRNGDSFDATVFDLEKQEQAWPPGTQTASYPTRAGATLAAWAALKRLGFTAKAAKPEAEPETETERQPASIWTISAQETVVRGKGLAVHCVAQRRDGIWEATASLDPYEFYGEFKDELSAKHAVLQFAKNLIDWHL